MGLKEFDLENTMSGKIQKWIHGHVHKCIKMLKWQCFNIMFQSVASLKEDESSNMPMSFQ